ncbi:hypothetical protein GCM10010970_30920 [Silvimonas iriomotensis]|uniref:Uncharacterized protein n=1 Tax=Silvimonas iriomotensis TaxID=449662 RepID=A0ABQ2PCZ2_9NEIS|nr:hypothetical protein GCM10010970_30920 [Silvimonas iriomotensis]
MIGLPYHFVIPDLGGPLGRNPAAMHASTTESAQDGSGRPPKAARWAANWIPASAGMTSQWGASWIYRCRYHCHFRHYY